MASRVSKNPVALPQGVDVTIAGQDITIKGGKGSLAWTIHPEVKVVQEDKQLQVVYANEAEPNDAIAGTTRALVNNMVIGVSEGFEKRLELRGVGYRAQVKGKVIELTLGFSHPVEHAIPEGIQIETPSQTEVVVKGIDKQAVGQVAAEIRAYRPPEPYKGKGVRYVGERVVMKEVKKK